MRSRRPHAAHGDPTNAINATLYDKLSYNFIRDIAPVAGVTRVPNVMVVNPAFPAKTVPEFIAYAKANPDRINMASGGTGPSQMSGELFKMLAGVNLVHVPYRGAGPALPDLISGQVQVMFVAITSSIEYIKAGRLRALGVTTTTRSEALPDVPTIADFVSGYEDSNWWASARPGYARDHRRQAQPGDQRRARRSQDQGAARRAWRHRARRLPGRLRQAHRRRN